MDSRAWYAIGVLVFIVAIQSAVIVALLIRERQHMRADRTLRESEERFRRILEGAPVAAARIAHAVYAQPTLRVRGGDCYVRRAIATR